MRKALAMSDDATRATDEDTVFTVKLAAAKLGVSPSLVYGLLAAGKIRHSRYGVGRGTIRITQEALDEYKQAAEQQSAALTLVHIIRPLPSSRLPAGERPGQRVSNRRT
jgi:excisionase family DNA binding protein